MKPSPPELRAALHRGNPGDVAFYRRLCAGGARVLELGAGYGRVAIPLARAGSEVVALDVDREMLALAEATATSEPSEVRARLSYTVQDMTSFSLGRRFERVIIPYNGLCCLLEPGDLRACLEHARDHLVAGGRLALDVYRANDPDEATDQADEPEADEPGDDEGEPLVAIEHEGRIYLVYEESRWQPAPPRLDTRYRFVPEGGGEALEQLIRQRTLGASELEALVTEADLSVVELAGGFHGEPFDDEAEQLVLIAERKA